jgi:hypothetical protein
MSLTRILALCVVLLGAIAGAHAQGNSQENTQDGRWLQDWKPLLPSVVPLPPKSQLNPGSVGGTTTPYTTAPQQTTTPSPTQSAPGLRLTIPSR